jgi:hypothetical protein
MMAGASPGLRFHRFPVVFSNDCDDSTDAMLKLAALGWLAHVL